MSTTPDRNRYAILESALKRAMGEKNQEFCIYPQLTRDATGQTVETYTEEDKAHLAENTAGRKALDERIAKITGELRKIEDHALASNHLAVVGLGLVGILLLLLLLILFLILACVKLSPA